MNENESWRNSGPIAVLLAILALLGFRTFTSDSPTPSGEQSTAHREHSGPAEGDERRNPANETQGRKKFWQPLRAFREASAPDDLAREIAGLGDDLTDIDGWEMRYLIACVPDPIDSTSGHRFDVLIDTIQRAAETQGYVYDRGYYPWLRKKTVEVTTDGTLTEDRPGGGRVRLLAQSVSRKQEGGDSLGEPGLLLLRSAGDQSRRQPRRLLLVFLVGETSTAGLNKEAFAVSLEFIKKMRRYRAEREIPILGPYFSGSQNSLEQIIETFAWQEMLNQLPPFPADPLWTFAIRPKFHIITGDALSINKHELETCDWRLAEVHFHATVAPSDAIMDALYEYLNLGRREGDFAILYECNTAFGLRVKARPERREGITYEPTWFPFPLHVSEIRNAYNKLAGPARENIIRLPSFGSKLQLPTRRSHRPRDVEPSLDPDMTAAMSERLLAQMLETIAHRRFRYVLIVATDIQDKLFLAGLVRQHCPESRLVFVESDLHFTHPDFSSFLRGSIVGSPYPLYSRDQRWSFPFGGDKRRLSFSGSGEQGYYNAVVLLLNLDHKPKAHDALVEYGPPFPKLYGSTPPLPPIQCPEDASAPGPSSELLSSRVDECRPPVWISIIGEGGLYPVAVVPNRITQDSQGGSRDSYKDYVYPANANAREKARFFISHQALFIVPVLAITLLLIYTTWSYLVVVLHRPQWQSGMSPPGGTQLQKLFWPRSDRLRWRQRLYAAVCLTSVLIVYGYLVFVWLLPLGHGLLVKDSPVRVRPWQWIAPVVLLFILGVFCETMAIRLGLGVVSLRRNPRALLRLLRQISGEPPVLWAIPILLLLVAAYLYTNGGWPREWQPGETLLFADRAMALASGVSPVVPILFIGLAFFAWSYAQLKRLYLLENEAEENPCPWGDEPFPRIALWHDEVQSDLLRPRQALLLGTREQNQTRLTYQGSFLFWFIWILLFFAFSRLSIHFVPAVEGVVTETLLLLSLTILSTLIVYGWFHLWKLWGSLHQLLNALALLPLRAAYQRIPTAITNQLGPYLFQIGSSFFHAKPDHRSLYPYRLDQHRLLIAEYPSIAVAVNTAAALPAPLQAKLNNTLQQAVGDLAHTAQDCFSLLQHIYHHSHLAERLFEKPHEEKAGHPCPCPREADHSLNIHKTVKTATRRRNFKQKIQERIRSKISVDPAVRHWLARVEDFVALEVAVYLSQLFAQLRNLAFYLSVIPVLFLLAVTSYPFQPQRLWMILSVTLIGLVTLSVLWIFFQIERNEMVSRIVKTTPNRLNFHWAFLSHVLVYAVPLLTILVALSSDMSDLVHSWLDPLLGLMK